MDLPDPIKVVLIDDHPLFRAAAAAALRDVAGIAIVGEASDGAAALPLISRERPHVVLVDIRLPDIGGIELVPRIRAAHPSTKIIMLSAFAYEVYVRRAVDARRQRLSR